MAEAKQNVEIVPPFAIEADHPRMCDVILQSIVGLRLRSRIRPTTTTVQGQVRTHTMGGHSLPDVPGMRLFVNPAKLEYAIVDPFNDDPEAQAKVKQYMRLTRGFRSTSPIKGRDTVKTTVDKNRMKTLCREVIRLLDEGAVKMVEGPAPVPEDVDDLPGKFLLNPGLRTQSTQPTYEEDYDEWCDRMSRSGAV